MTGIDGSDCLDPSKLHAILKVLMDYGLTATESEVYLFLARNGALGAGEVVRRLGLHLICTFRAGHVSDATNSY